MAKSAGNTIVVAGGGGAGGGSRGGGSGSNGESKPSSGKGSKLKINDEMFNTALMALAGVGVVAYVYYTRPDLVTEFLGTITGNKAPQVPVQPAGTVQNDVMPQQPAGVAPAPTQGQWGGEMQYPQFPQQSTGMEQFQYPQQQSPNLQQYQPYQPTGYGGGGAGAADISTSYNPMFSQNSNTPTYSFAARRLSKLDYDSSDGMLRQV